MTIILALVQLISFFTRMNAVQATSIATSSHVGVGAFDAAAIKPRSWLRRRHNARANSSVTWNSGTTSNEIAKSASKLVSALVTIPWIFLHAAKDDCLESRVNVGINERWWLRSLIDLLHGNANCIVANKGNATSSSFVHDNTQGIDIGGWSQRFAGTLLWRNIVSGTENRVIGG